MSASMSESPPTGRSITTDPGTRTFSPDGVALRAEGVERRFGLTEALTGLDLEIPEHAFFLLVGRNGAGKTTFLRIVLDLLAPTAGSLSVLGMDPRREGPSIRAAAGYVPEDRDWPFRRMTVSGFLDYHAAYRPWWDGAYAEHLVEALELPPHRPVGNLSKGEFRRMQLTAALAHRPPLLVLDEPTDGLDPLLRERLKELLAEHLASWPTTVLLSTHVVGEVEGFADHLAVLREGRAGTVLTRERLAKEGRRALLAVPAGWNPPPLGPVRLLRRDGTPGESEGHVAPGEEAWITLGDERELRRRLEASGAQVLDTRPLRLEEAAVALLGTER